MDRSRLRKGSLGGKSIFLASWVEQPYARIYQEILPDRIDIPGASGKIEGDPTIRSWIIDDWSGGYGEPVWREGLAAYNDSSGLRPHPFGPGLALGPEYNIDTVGSLVCNEFGNALWVPIWLDGAGDNIATWGGSGWTSQPTSTAGTGDYESAACVDGGEWYATTSTNEIHKFTGYATRAVHYASGTFTNPIVAAFGGTLYALDDDGLYIVDRSTANTRTQVVDAVETDRWNTAAGQDRRLVATDNGVAWLAGAPNGFVYLHEYNHFDESHSIAGVIPPNAPSGGVLYYGRGFAWVLYQESSSGDGYLWFKGGGQEGVVGPFDLASGNALGVIFGFVGDDLLFAFGGRLLAYNISSGGLHKPNKSSGQSIGLQCGYLYQGQVFSGYGGAAAWRYDWNAFDLTTALWNTLDTGRFDFDYPGFDKIFTEVIVYTDEGDGWDGSLALEYSVDGGTFTAHADTKTISSSNRKHTFTLSNSTTTVKGHELELRLKMKSDGTDAPIIRKVVARAMPAEMTEEIVLQLDLSYPRSEGESPRSADLIADLKALAESGDVVSFENPWEVEDHEAPETVDVKIVEVVVPPEGAESLPQAIGSVRVRVV